MLKAARAAFRARRGTLIECLQSCPGDEAARWYARLLLQAMTAANPIAPDLIRWAESPNTKRADVYRLLDRAIGRTGGHRGGWLVVIPGGKP